jgi:hypothetical protein
MRREQRDLAWVGVSVVGAAFLFYQALKSRAAPGSAEKKAGRRWSTLTGRTITATL